MRRCGTDLEPFSPPHQRVHEPTEREDEWVVGTVTVGSGGCASHAATNAAKSSATGSGEDERLRRSGLPCFLRPPRFLPVKLEKLATPTSFLQVSSTGDCSEAVALPSSKEMLDWSWENGARRSTS